MAPKKQQKQIEIQQADPDKNCRLRNGLNPHCLAEIFQYLSDADVIRLSGMNEYYESIIRDYVISKKVIKFHLTTARTEYTNIFQKFGKKIKRIHFSGDPRRFRFLLENIAEYCAKDQLEDVRLNKICEYYGCECEKIFETTITPQMITKMIPYFRNVQSLMLQSTHLRLRGGQWHLPQAIFAQSKQIHTLILDKVLLNEEHLRWHEMKNLRDITLIDLNDFNQSTFIEYLKRKPKLLRFTQKGDMNIGDIGKALAQYCGDTIHCFRHYGHDMQSVDIRTQYEFLSEFKKLTHITLTSIYTCASDLFYPLKKLADKNMLESLEIYQMGVKMGAFTPARETLLQSNFGELRQLKRLAININDTNDCDPEHLLFILNRPANVFQNVRTLVLSGNRTDKSISKIINNVPNLRKLFIINLRVCNSLIGTRKMVTSIRQIVEKRKTDDGALKRNDFVDVVAYGENWREFAVYENKYINLANRGSDREIQDFAIQGTAKIPRLDL